MVNKPQGKGFSARRNEWQAKTVSTGKGHQMQEEGRSGMIGNGGQPQQQFSFLPSLPPSLLPRPPKPLSLLETGSHYVA